MDWLPITSAGHQHILREFRRESVLVVSDPLRWSEPSMCAVHRRSNRCVDRSAQCFKGCIYILRRWRGHRTILLRSPNIDYPENHGNGAYNLVNNLFNADMWWYIDQIGYDPGKKENELVTFKLPVPCKLKQSQFGTTRTMIQ